MAGRGYGNATKSLQVQPCWPRLSTPCYGPLSPIFGRPIHRQLGWCHRPLSLSRRLRFPPLGPHPFAGAAIWLEIGGALLKTVIEAHGSETRCPLGRVKPNP